MSGNPAWLAGVAGGAVITALGAFAATQLTIIVDRRRQARAAMLLCGEVLAVVRRFLRHVHEQRQAVGALDARTWRMLHAARREMHVYERNREILLHIHDPQLRARIHSVMVRLTIPLDVLMEAACGRTAESLEADHLCSVDLICGQHEPVCCLLEQLEHRCRQPFSHFDLLDGEPASRAFSHGPEVGGSRPVSGTPPKPLLVIRRAWSSAFSRRVDRAVASPLPIPPAPIA